MGALLTAITLLAADAAPARVKVAVLDLKAVGVDPTIAENVSEFFTASIDELGCCLVISRAEISAMLGFEKEKQLLNCAEEQSCIAEIGGALGVEKLASGTAGKLVTPTR